MLLFQWNCANDKLTFGVEIAAQRAADFELHGIDQLSARIFGAIKSLEERNEPQALGQNAHRHDDGNFDISVLFALEVEADGDEFENVVVQRDVLQHADLVPTARRDDRSGKGCLKMHIFLGCTQ